MTANLTTPLPPRDQRTTNPGEQTTIAPRVAVVAPYPAVRVGLTVLLTTALGNVVVGEATGGSDLNRRWPVLHPDVVVCDLAGSESDDALPRVVAAAQGAERNAALCVLTDSPADDLLTLFASDLSGWACVLRDSEADTLASAVRAALSGLIVVENSLKMALLTLETMEPRPVRVGEGAGRARDEFPGESLTPRELEVLQAMAEGLPNKIIATRLRISLHTVKFHVAQILAKLNATSRTEAVTLAARRGQILL